MRIDEALDLWLGAEAYADLSESMQWRVDATLQVTLAALELAVAERFAGALVAGNQAAARAAYDYVNAAMTVGEGSR